MTANNKYTLPLVPANVAEVNIFDLDETLFTGPAFYAVMLQHVRRIHLYMADKLNKTVEEAGALSEHYYKTYGSTFRGLVLNHPHVDPHDYMRETFSGLDYSPIQEDPRLISAFKKQQKRAQEIEAQQKIEQLKKPEQQAEETGPAIVNVVMTNSSQSYAQEVCTRLGIARFFHAFIDPTFIDFESKTRPQAYRLALGLLGVPATAKVTMHEDLSMNTRGAKIAGINSVLVIPPQNFFASTPDAHTVTRDLAGLIENPPAYPCSQHPQVDLRIRVGRGNTLRLG